jgi:hypothetical protein
MKRTLLMVWLGISLLFNLATAGEWTANEFIYKPAMGARGQTEKNGFDAGMNRIDARLGKEYWVGDPKVGSTLPAAVSYLGSTVCTLRVPRGTYSLTADLTVPANITLAPERGAVFNIATGITLTLNGGLVAASNQQVFSCVGTGKVKFGRGSVKELYPQWWGAKGDGVTDDTAALQAAVDCAVASRIPRVFVPSGTYKLTDTLKIGYGDNKYASVHLKGCLSNVAGAEATCFDASGFGDRPALNVQGGRSVVLENFVVYGKNAAPLDPNVFQPASHIDINESHWVSSGCNDTRYSPYAGVCVDAYTGAKPSGGYDNDVYGRWASSSTTIRNVYANRFVVGICLSPNGDGGNDEAVVIDKCNTEWNTYGVSVGSSQCRAVTLRDHNSGSNWCNVTTIRHGLQNGQFPTILGGAWGYAYKLFEIAAGYGAADIQGGYAEGFVYIGELGIAYVSSHCPVHISGFGFDFDFGLDYRAPFAFVAHEPVVFGGCSFASSNQTAKAWNFVADAGALFNACSFPDPPSGEMLPMGLAVDTSEAYSFQRCAAHGDSFELNDRMDRIAGNLGRRVIGNRTSLIHDAYSGNLYKITKYSYQNYGFVSGGNISSVSLSGTGYGATLTFTASQPERFRAGDLLAWRVPEPGYPAYTQRVPAFVVTAVNGSSITATSFFDGLDGTYSPSSIVIVCKLFVNATEATGTVTSGSNQITSVTNIGNFQVGDWIRGSYLADYSRITAIDAQNNLLTLNQNATGSASGVALYNCRMEAL